MLRGICWVQTSPKAAHRLVVVCKCFSARAFFTCRVLLWAELLVLFVLWTSQRPPLFVCVSKQFQTTFQQQFSTPKWHCYRAESSCRAKRFGRVFSNSFLQSRQLTLYESADTCYTCETNLPGLENVSEICIQANTDPKFKHIFRKLVPPPSLLRRKVIGNISRSQARNYYFYLLIRKKDSSSYSVCIPKYHQL